MSTVCKLDPSVRARRADRAAQLRALKADIRQYDALILRGKNQLLTLSEHPEASPEYIAHQSAPVREMLSKLHMMRTVVAMTLKHLTKLCKDPSRTGESKDAVLAKLGEMTAAATVKTEGVFGA